MIHLLHIIGPKTVIHTTEKGESAATHPQNINYNVIKIVKSIFHHALAIYNLSL